MIMSAVLAAPIAPIPYDYGMQGSFIEPWLDQYR